MLPDQVQIRKVDCKNTKPEILASALNCVKCQILIWISKDVAVVYIQVSNSVLSHVRPFATLDCSPPGSSLSMGFFRQEYWSGLSSPSPEDLPNLEIEPTFPALQVHSLPTEPSGKPITVFKITFFYYKSDISYG